MLSFFGRQIHCCEDDESKAEYRRHQCPVPHGAKPVDRGGAGGRLGLVEDGDLVADLGAVNHPALRIGHALARFCHELDLWVAPQALRLTTSPGTAIAVCKNSRVDHPMNAAMTRKTTPIAMPAIALDMSPLDFCRSTRGN